MQIEISGLRVVVTAAGQGIGRAIAAAFADNGARVHICDIDEERLAATEEALPGVTTSIANVAEPNEVQSFIERAASVMGGIDVLVNNAGIAGPTGPVEDVLPEQWLQTMNVNINGQFYCVREVVPIMKAQIERGERPGSIINISTTAGLHGYPLRSPYAASKWAVIGLTKTLAMELGEVGIRVNVICPGSINNERMDNVITKEAAVRGISEVEVRNAYERQVSLRTFIEPEEIANMALFISSPLGAKISGQVLCVDGHTETMRT